MSVTNIVIGLLVVAWLVSRQLRVRPVREANPYRISLILAVVGVIEVVNYLRDKTVPTAGYLLLAGGLVLAAVFGYLRALTTRVWRQDDGVAVRQGNAWTVVLWVVGLAIHIGGDLWLEHVAPEAKALGSVSLLLYLGITIAAQRWVVTDRARALARTSA